MRSWSRVRWENLPAELQVLSGLKLSPLFRNSGSNNGTKNIVAQFDRETKSVGVYHPMQFCRTPLPSYI